MFLNIDKSTFSSLKIVLDFGLIALNKLYSFIEFPSFKLFLAILYSSMFSLTFAPPSLTILKTFQILSKLNPTKSQ